MSSQDESGASGHAGDDHFQEAHAYFKYLDHCNPGTQGGSETNPDTDAGTATESGTATDTDTTPKSGEDADLVGEGPNTKGARNQMSSALEKSW